MKFFLKLICLFYLSISFGQTQYLEGEKHDSERKINYSEFTDVTDSGEVVNISLSKKMNQLSFKRYFSLNYFDKDLNLLKVKDITKEIDGSIINMSVINNTINIISAEPSINRVKKIVRYSCPINNFEFDTQVLIENNKTIRDIVKSSFSESKELFSIITKKSNQDNEVCEVKLFDKNFKLIYNTEISGFTSSKEYSVNDIYTLNDRSILILISSYENSKKEKWTNQLIKINRDGFNVLKIDTKNKFVNDLKLFVTEDKIYFAGHFSDFKEHEDLKGFYISKLDRESFKQDFIKLTEFNDDYVDDINKQILRKNFEQLNYLKLSDFYVNEDSYYIINESLYSNTMTEAERGLTSGGSITTFYFGNLAINKFDIDGNLLKYDVIYKEHPSNYFLPIQSTFLKIYKNEKFYIYNLSGRFEDEGNEIFTFKKDLPINCYEIKYDEELNKQINEHENFYFNNINVFNFKNDYFLLFYSKQYKIGLMKIIPN